MNLRPLLVALLIAMSALAAGSAQSQQWFVTPSSANSAQLQMSYGTVSNAPQYAVLDTSVGYLRLVYGPSAGWGTSILTMPAYWTGGKYIQGIPQTVTWKTANGKLILLANGSSNGMSIAETITIDPPANNSITAKVAVNVTGTVPLDPKPGEAFKPVFLSSMHDSSTVFDASVAYAGSKPVALPLSGWIVGPTPPTVVSKFGLIGGTSTWKTNAPSVEIKLNSPLQVAGWVTQETDPNGDNVGYWAASSSVLSSWTYTIIANNSSTVPAHAKD